MGCRYFQKQQLRKVKSIQVTTQDAVFSLNKDLQKHPKVSTHSIKKSISVWSKKSISVWSKKASLHFEKRLNLKLQSIKSDSKSVPEHFGQLLLQGGGGLAVAVARLHQLPGLLVELPVGRLQLLDLPVLLLHRLPDGLVEDDLLLSALPQLDAGWWQNLEMDGCRAGHFRYFWIFQ